MRRQVMRRWIALLGLAVVVVGVVMFARPIAHLLTSSAGDRDERIETPPGYADDASRLELTRVAERVEVDPDDAEGQLAALLSRARAEGLRVSIAGARHSMGGHTIYPGGIVLEMGPLREMALDENRDVLRVGAGALWSDVIPYLDARGRSVDVMQSDHSFSVGGSLSANCHGWQYGSPPIASTVESFRLMKADGEIVRCSRRENAELFSLALGGYGLFGIILDADLRVRPNERYRLEQHLVPVAGSLTAFEDGIRDRPGVQLVYARLCMVPSRLFSEVLINAFVRDEGPIPALEDPESMAFRRAVFRGSVGSDYGKELRWRLETEVQPLLIGKVFSRNQLMNESVASFENHSAERTDILHEYFVPRAGAADFVQAAGALVIEHAADLLNVTVRDVRADEDTLLRYANGDVLAFVMLLNQSRTPDGERRMQLLTRALIDASLEHGGRYYLPYRLHATLEQFHAAYPQAGAFFAAKREYDPEELFQNRFYMRYGQN